MQFNKQILLCTFSFCFVYNVYCNSCENERNNYCTCKISTIQEVSNEVQPLLLQINNTPEFLYPKITSPKTIKLKADEIQARVACPSSFVTVQSINQNVSSSFLVCIGNSNFRLTHSQKDISSFNQISCSKEPVPIAKLKNVKYCPAKSCVEIGFQLDVFDFLPIIKSIEINSDILQVSKAYVKITPVIEFRQTGTKAWPLRRGPIFQNVQMNMSDIYQRDYQRNRFLQIFENAVLADKYISKTDDLYLTASQLISERDLFYKSQQTGAFYHENIVPMWRSIAEGNWELVGHFVRKLASETLEGLHVWSGTIGILALPDHRSCMKTLFLFEDKFGNHKAIPVPKLLYKYVYDEHQHRGLVLLTVNDPHLVYGITDDLLVCQEQRICQDLNPDFASHRRGFTYCCSLKSFAHLAHRLSLPTFPGAASIAQS